MMTSSMGMHASRGDPRLHPGAGRGLFAELDDQPASGLPLARLEDILGLYPGERLLSIAFRVVHLCPYDGPIGGTLFQTCFRMIFCNASDTSPHGRKYFDWKGHGFSTVTCPIPGPEIPYGVVQKISLAPTPGSGLAPVLAAAAEAGPLPTGLHTSHFYLLPADEDGSSADDMGNGTFWTESIHTGLEEVVLVGPTSGDPAALAAMPSANSGSSGRAPLGRPEKVGFSLRCADFRVHEFRLVPWQFYEHVLRCGFPLTAGSSGPGGAGGAGAPATGPGQGTAAPSAPAVSSSTGPGTGAYQPRALFAFRFQPAYQNPDDWRRYSGERDLERVLGTDPRVAVARSAERSPLVRAHLPAHQPNGAWRISTANAEPEHAICGTYCTRLGVPAAIDDEQLARAASFRSKSRVPILSWLHPLNGASLTRCSQPNVGLLGNMHPDDETYLNLLGELAACAHGNLATQYEHRLMQQATGRPRAPVTNPPVATQEALSVDSGAFSLPASEASPVTSSLTASASFSGMEDLSDMLSSMITRTGGSAEADAMMAGLAGGNNAAGATPVPDVPLMIMDARPQLNAIANQAKGAGYERVSFYRSARLVFLGIDNIHVMSGSIRRMLNLCFPFDSVLEGAAVWQTSGGVLAARSSDAMEPGIGPGGGGEAPVAGPPAPTDTPLEPGEHLVVGNAPPGVSAAALPGGGHFGPEFRRSRLDFHSRVEATRWLDYVQLLLASAVTIADHLNRDAYPVLVHCSDGWDRTSQLCALSMLLLDPEYRTIQGFARLVAKEWTGAGHKFAHRLGYANRTQSNERSPIFLQFLDSVHQLLVQFPAAFEFRIELLVFLADEALACRFGDFLFNCDRERHEHGVFRQTCSLWSYVLGTREGLERFRNPVYALVPGVLRPSTAARRLRLWAEFYLRWSPVLGETVSRATRQSADRLAVMRAAVEAMERAAGVVGV
ncbi:hypothetical protein H696_00438 [Fonticula alba]|uniref:Uncharacterized protein n=1 Tax=Fonticula alba TaxID=691883 RepID=A0A058ZEN0_FONAL|nr:hypothetical protein H696_00438 [Fonticula alba]KCV72865.1 hypothetical protein H696_00438 [Fonticula alba]|eukprot:XP_009492566.1 hypothetical protein H696_00438 [Fonticula alba]